MTSTAGMWTLQQDVENREWLAVPGFGLIKKNPMDETSMDLV